MKRSYRDLLILAGVFVLIWVIFSQYNDFIRTDEHLISKKNQVRLADNLREMVFNRYDTLRSEVVRNSMDSIVSRLKTGLDSIDYEFNVYILHDTTINAFATLQGDIYVFSGLIGFSDSPEMLASVIAHEMGHIVNDHYVERLTRELGINVVFTILTGGDASTVGELSKSLFSLTFSRDEEREADRFASDLLLKTGINPSYSTQFFLKLQREEVHDFSEAMEIFMTHPDLKERIEQTASVTTPEDFDEVRFDLDWDEVLSELNY
jgi:predicted Zn-dependent protease